MDTDPTVLVRRGSNHGMDTAAYAAALRERLDVPVVHERTPDAEAAAVADAEVVTGGSLSGELLESAASLRLFAGTAAGYDHLPLDAFRERGVTVTNAAGVHAPNVAEQVLGWVLTFARNLHEGARRQRRGEWRHFQARELAGETVAVVGLGRIGTAVVERLAGFGVETVGVRHTPSKGGPTDAVYGYDGVHEAVADAGYVVLACPLSEETRSLVDADLLTTMRPDAVLVNVARGGVVDQPALVDALRGNRLRGAALDVTDPEPLPRDDPLWDLENVLLTPHNAGHSPALFDRLADLVAGNVRRLRDGDVEALENVVASP